MPEFVLRVEGEYALVFEAPDIETAALLAQVGSEQITTAETGDRTLVDVAEVV